ncbi:MAG TPA: DUF2877 domain-containing protein [Actinomycetales bacterium]|nr:DUF2877 domain-containing protein [Actinomycetales bacterium]
MRLIDIGIDAARMLRVAGVGQVRAVFGRAVYLDVPGGLVSLVVAPAPRGPLHLRVPALPATEPDFPVMVGSATLTIADSTYPLDAPLWVPRLPPAALLAPLRPALARWLPDAPPALDVGPAGCTGLPPAALAALRRGDLLSLAAMIGGRGPGLTPAGDDVLAGVLLVANALRTGASPGLLLDCASRAQTNDFARAFLGCAARGRSIQPAHELLAALARANHEAVNSAVGDLRRFGSSSGAALTYGIRVALLELPGRRST